MIYHNYLLHIPETIIRLMGFEDRANTDQIYDVYFDLVQRITPKSADELKTTLHENAEMVYEKLLLFK